jgi:hypothetical protein
MSSVLFALVCIAASVLVTIFIIQHFQYARANEISIVTTAQTADVQNEVSQTIQENSTKLYDQTVSRMDFALTLFSCGIGVFTIIFGLFYFTKIKDMEDLIDDKPDTFFKSIYKRQYDTAILDIFASDNIKRYEAIKNISNNPDVNNNIFDTLKNVLQKEFDYPRNAFFNQNISNLVCLMIKLDKQRTVQFLISYLIETKFDLFRSSIFLQYIVVDESPEARSFIENKLQSDKDMGSQIVSYLAINKIIDEYSEFIIVKCDGIVLQQIISSLSNNVWHIRTDNFMEYLNKREIMDAQTMNQIINSSALSNVDILRLLLKHYKKDKIALEQSLNVFISKISVDEEEKKSFVSTIEESGCLDDIREFFSRQQYLRTYFKDYAILNSNTDNNANGEQVDIKNLVSDFGLHLTDEGKIVDKNGTEYVSQNCSMSIFTGAYMPVVPCVQINGKTIPVSEISKQVENDNA